MSRKHTRDLNYNAMLMRDVLESIEFYYYQARGMFLLAETVRRGGPDAAKALADLTWHYIADAHYQAHERERSFPAVAPFEDEALFRRLYTERRG